MDSPSTPNYVLRSRAPMPTTVSESPDPMVLQAASENGPEYYVRGPGKSGSHSSLSDLLGSPSMTCILDSLGIESLTVRSRTTTEDVP